ncbi:MAG TPA: nucleoside monophosphate kinase, partial [archaeon]|nr:nucleoside monophosphate kinase [archaeon]
MNFIFLAKQGTGKGTYAQAMQEKYGLVQVSTGDLCREEAKKNTETGKKVAEALKAGKYVDDAIVTELLRQRLQEPDCGKGFILDGYPRTLEQ